MIESVDQSLGSIVQKLEELNLPDNTHTFTSDNGGHGKWTSNYPFRGNKEISMRRHTRPINSQMVK